MGTGCLTDRVSGGVRTLCRRWAGRRGVPLFLVFFSTVLALPSFWIGLQWDDYIEKVSVVRPPAVTDVLHSPLNMFTFATGDLSENRTLMDKGWLPWWSLPNLKMAFFRPLSALTHWLDYGLWPGHTWLMHVHNFVWFGLLLLTVTRLYSRLLGNGATAFLAALLFTCDDAHGMPMGWVANRNAVIAALFAMLALLFHDLWKRDGWKAGAFLAPLSLLLGLLAGEMTLAGTAFLVSYCLFLQEGNWKGRLLSCLPSLAVSGVWFLGYRAMGFGTFGSAWYSDPGHDPLAFLLGVLERAPVLLFAQWGFLPADLYVLLTPLGRLLFWALSLGFLALLLRLFLPVLKGRKEARFFLLSLLLSLFPICTTLPFDRLLLLVGFAAMGLLAVFLAWALEVSATPGEEQGRVGRACTGMVRAAVPALLVMHLILSPIGLPLKIWSLTSLGDTLATASASFPTDPEIGRQEAVFVNGPCSTLGGFFLPVRLALEGKPVPPRSKVLATGIQTVRVERIGPASLRIVPEKGFLGGPREGPGGPWNLWGLVSPGRIFALMDETFRDTRFPFRPGEDVRLEGLTVEPGDLDDRGMPRQAVFRFASPLEDPSRRWFQWKKGRYVPFTPPGEGETVTLPAPTGLFPVIEALEGPKADG